MRAISVVVCLTQFLCAGDGASVVLFFDLHSDFLFFLIFFFNDTATTEIYTLSLHDALPIYLQFLNRKTMEPPISK